MTEYKIYEHHEQAAQHYDQAAKHHREAAKHHRAGNHEKAASSMSTTGTERTC